MYITIHVVFAYTLFMNIYMYLHVYVYTELGQIRNVFILPPSTLTSGNLLYISWRAHGVWCDDKDGFAAGDEHLAPHIFETLSIAATCICLCLCMCSYMYMYVYVYTYVCTCKYRYHSIQNIRHLCGSTLVPTFVESPSWGLELWRWISRAAGLFKRSNFWSWGTRDLGQSFLFEMYKVGF